MPLSPPPSCRADRSDFETSLFGPSWSSLLDLLLHDQSSFFIRGTRGQGCLLCGGACSHDCSDGGVDGVKIKARMDEGDGGCRKLEQEHRRPAFPGPGWGRPGSHPCFLLGCLDQARGYGGCDESHRIVSKCVGRGRPHLIMTVVLGLQRIVGAFGRAYQQTEEETDQEACWTNSQEVPDNRITPMSPGMKRRVLTIPIRSPCAFGFSASRLSCREYHFAAFSIVTSHVFGASAADDSTPRGPEYNHEAHHRQSQMLDPCQAIYLSRRLHPTSAAVWSPGHSNPLAVHFRHPGRQVVIHYHLPR